MQTVPKKRNTLGCLLLGVLLVASSIGSALVLRTPAASVASASDACYMAQKFVKNTLKAPSTATFAPCREPETVVTQTNRIWNVHSYVDAQNGLGAILRNDYTAKLIYYPATDSWTLVDVNIQSR